VFLTLTPINSVAFNIISILNTFWTKIIKTILKTCLISSILSRYKVTLKWNLRNPYFIVKFLRNLQTKKTILKSNLVNKYKLKTRNVYYNKWYVIKRTPHRTGFVDSIQWKVHRNPAALIIILIDILRRAVFAEIDFTCKPMMMIKWLG